MSFPFVIFSHPPYQIAYAGDTIVNTWLEVRGFTTDDLEGEIKRLDGAMEGKRVGPPIIDILRMNVEVNEKRKLLVLTG
jgi:hypothetical protein